MCLRLSDASVICHVTYFQFPIQSAFPRIDPVSRMTWPWSDDVIKPRCVRTLCHIVKFVYEHALNVAENVFWCAAYSPEERLELIITVIMESRQERQRSEEFLHYFFLLSLRQGPHWTPVPRLLPLAKLVPRRRCLPRGQSVLR